MTEKRFILEEFGLNFIVNDNGRNLTARKTVDILNELHDENEQLKQQIRDLYKFVKCDVDNEIDVYPKSILGYLVNILKIIGDVE